MTVKPASETRKPGLVGAAGIYLMGNIANAAVPFVLMPILTRVLSPAEYGIVAMYTVLLAIFMAFTGLSLHGAISVRYFRFSRGDITDFISVCLFLVLGMTLVTAGVVFLTGSWLEPWTGLGRDWMVVGVVVSGFQVLGLIRLILWQVSGKPLLYAVFQFGQVFSNAAGSLVLVLLAGLAWQGRLLGQSLTLVVFGVAAVILIWQAGLVRRPQNIKKHIRDALSFGVPLVPHVLGGLLIVAVDRFVIIQNMGLASAGIYLVAMQVGQILGFMTDAFNKAYAPWLMERLSNPDALTQRKVVAGTYFYFCVILAVGGLMGVMAPYGLNILVGDAFQGAGQFVIFTAMGFALRGCYLMVTNYLFYKNKTGRLAMMTLASGALNVVLCLLWIEPFGLAGAGAAFVTAQLISFLGTWWLAARVHHMSWFGQTT